MKPSRFTQLTNNNRAKERQQILAQITRDNPELSSFEGDKKIEQYMMQALDLHVQTQGIHNKANSEHSADDLVGTVFASPPQMPDLLYRTIKYWTTEPALTYSLQMLKLEIENIRLRKQVEGYKNLVEKYEKVAEESLDTADAAVKKVKDVNKSIDTDQRMN